MILIDYSHTQMRMLFIAVMKAKPRKKDGKFVTEDFFKMFRYLMLNSLRATKVKFSNKYGEMVLCLDDRNYWRKDVFPDYKGQRKDEKDKSEVNFDEFFILANEFIEDISKCFGYKIVKVPRVEADDIFGVLSKTYAKTQPVLCVTSDKDMKQCLEYGADLYDPIKGEFIKMSDEELKYWKLEHIIAGDEGDGVPHIKRLTEFSDNFHIYLKENGIDMTSNDKNFNEVLEFEKLDISKDLYEKYDVYKTNRKGEKLPTKDIFKNTVLFKKKFIENLEENLKQNKLYIKHFERNKKLVLFEYIPKEYQEKIIQAYKEAESNYDANCIMNYLMKNKLMELVKNITDFYIQPKTSVLDEW